MSPYLWLGVWFVGLAASVAAHEAGHVLVGRRYGWNYAGFTMKLDVGELQTAGPDGHVQLRPLRAHLGSRGCRAGQTMSPYLWLNIGSSGLRPPWPRRGPDTSSSAADMAGITPGSR